MNDQELIRTAAEFRKGILGRKKSSGMCYAVSAPLQALLSLYGVETELAKSEIDVWDGISFIEHCYLELPDGRILDPTADQLSDLPSRKLPRVYLGAKPEWFLPITESAK